MPSAERCAVKATFCQVSKEFNALRLTSQSNPNNLLSLFESADLLI
jgi:hypothetical protein